MLLIIKHKTIWGISCDEMPQIIACFDANCRLIWCKLQNHFYEMR